MASWVDDLRNGDDSDLHTDEDEALVARDEQAIAKLRLSDSTTAGAKEGEAAAPHYLPAVLRRIFGTEAEAELLAVAKLLDPTAKNELTMVFHTPIGDVKCPVSWSSTPPEMLHKETNLLLVLVRSSKSMFTPRSGSDLEISFEFGKHQTRSASLRVICLAPPMQLYPNVKVDLLCFLPHGSVVEKNGKLSEQAPSVVSGRPSDNVDEVGEPIARGEKSAAVRGIPLGADDDQEDFDKPRAAV